MEYPRHLGRAWHAHPGDAVEDTRNVPGVSLFMVGIGAVAATLVAAGSGFIGWAIIGAIVAASTMAAGATIIVVEHKRERTAELERGRPGHNPLVG